MNDISNEYGIHIPYHQAWNGKEIARKHIYGVEALSFNKLRRYIEVAIQTNPGSYFELQCDNDSDAEGVRFKRTFIAFFACIFGFHAGCRPLIFLDGTHIKSKYQGVLLCCKWCKWGKWYIAIGICHC